MREAVTPVTRIASYLSFFKDSMIPRIIKLPKSAYTYDLLAAVVGWKPKKPL